METDSILIKNNATSRKKLQNLWQGTTGNYRSLNEMETISTGCNGTIWDLDRQQELEIFQDNRPDDIWSYRTMTSLYGIFQGRQTWKQTSCQEKIK